MELLDMVPADAIALRLYFLPAAVITAGSLLAWLAAALAAAVALWRIRAVGSSKPDDGVRTALVDVKKVPPSLTAIAEQTARSEPTAPSEPSEPSKIRFTAYYGGGDDGVMDGVKKCAGKDDGVAVGGRWTATRRAVAATAARKLTAAPWEEREMAARRRGDLGWYSHLDMAALDGSVVRLWDGELTAAVASPTTGRIKRVGWEFQLSI